MWDSVEITLLGSVLFSLAFLILLYLAGFGFSKLVSLISTKHDAFASMDFFQRLNIRILLGAASIFLFLLILSPLGLSFRFISILILVVTIFVPLLIVLWSLRKRMFHTSFTFNFRDLSLNIIVIAILLACIFLASSLIAGRFGSTNDDGAFHSSIIRVILDNPGAILTGSTSPYSSFINTYPSAGHALSAFLVDVLQVPIEKIVVLFSVALPSLIALSIYSTVKFLFDSKILSTIAMFVAAFFSLSITWGPLSWGGLPVLLSLYVSISGMGVVFMFFEAKNRNWIVAFFMGLSFLLAINTYPVAFLVLSIWFFTVFTAGLIAKALNVGIKKSLASLFRRQYIPLIISFTIPLLFSLPYFYTVGTHSTAFLQNYPADVQYNQLVSGSDLINDIVRSRIDFNWVLDLPALSNFFSVFGRFFTIAALSVILLVGLFIAKLFGFEILSKRVLSSAILIYFFFLITMIVLTLMVSLPFSFFSLFNTERLWQHLIIPEVILASFVIFTFGYIVNFMLSDISKYRMKFGGRFKKMLLAILLIFLIFSVSYASLPFISDSHRKYGQLGLLLDTYGSLTSDDILLMNWIRDNIPHNSRILVSAGDGGQYLTAVTKIPSVYSYDLRIYSQSYIDLMSYMTSNPIDLRAVEIMQNNNISYVYIGSHGTTYSFNYTFRYQFNSSQLQSPYFSLINHVGNASFFLVNSSNLSS